ncbi:MAG: diaminopimelate epimerase [Endomicrobiaceae bacterium]|nr:diaminopimelate epimerase [Endomicrobiaceae bacterium]
MSQNNIQFYKLTAAGNDFVMIDNRESIIPEEKHSSLAAKLCDRRYSIGGDGLILLEKSNKADFRMRYYNSDGSHASMCGNGGRSIAKFAYELGAVKKNMKFETDAGLITAEIKSDTVVNLALYNPKDLKLNISIQAEDKQFEVSCLNTGVPHAVIFVDDVEKTDVVKYGRIIRFHKEFSPSGTNVNFVQLTDNNTILVRTYERGVEDETLACGTGVTASSIISVIKKKVVSPVHIITRGKDNLFVSCSADESKISDVYLEGPAVVAFTGTVKVG